MISTLPPGKTIPPSPQFFVTEVPLALWRMSSECRRSRRFIVDCRLMPDVSPGTISERIPRRRIMKLKSIAFLLTLAVASWAQTGTQTSPQQSTASGEKTAGACCDKGASAESKDAHACCAHHNMAAKDGKESSCCAGTDQCKGKASCCSGKDAASCARSKNQTASACCGSEKCGKECKKGCCNKKPETTARNRQGEFPADSFLNAGK